MNNPPKIIDRSLLKKLDDDTDYIIHKSVEGLSEFYHNNAITESNSSINLVQALYNASDTVSSFIDDELIKDSDEKINTTKLHDEYLSYCDKNERTPLTIQNFYRNLESKGFQKYKSGGKFYFKGLNFKPSDFIECDDEVNIFN